MLEYDVFGRRVLIERHEQAWRAYYRGPDGKRRDAVDVRLPPHLSEQDLARYLADHFHEIASPEQPEVRRIR